MEVSISFKIMDISEKPKYSSKREFQFYIRDIDMILESWMDFNSSPLRAISTSPLSFLRSLYELTFSIKPLVGGWVKI